MAADLAVAAIVSIPGLLTGLAALHTSRATNSIVTGNGKGNVAEMGAKALDRLDSLEAKQDDVLAWQGRHEARHRRHDAAHAL